MFVLAPILSVGKKWEDGGRKNMKRKPTNWGRLFKAGLALTLGENLTHCSSFCISTHLFTLKLRDFKLASI